MENAERLASEALSLLNRVERMRNEPWRVPAEQRYDHERLGKVVRRAASRFNRRLDMMIELASEDPRP